MSTAQYTDETTELVLVHLFKSLLTIYRQAYNRIPQGMELYLSGRGLVLNGVSNWLVEFVFGCLKFFCNI